LVGQPEVGDDEVQAPPPQVLAEGLGFGHACGGQDRIAAAAQDLPQHRPHAFKIIHD
jgi:hypothetical protein